LDIDLDRVAYTETLDDRSKLLRWVERSSTVDDFLDQIRKSDSDFKVSLPGRTREPGLAGPRPGERVRSLMASERSHSSFGEFLGIGVESRTERVDELRELDLMLRKRSKNNVILVGEPGTGKTHLVEAYASCGLSESRIFRVDVPKIMGGTKYRGELESKFSQIYDAAIKEGFILFVDEIHALAEMGSAEGGFSVLDMLKPYLTRPDFRIIGATTRQELPALSKDLAFRRRFSILRLSAMSSEQLRLVFLEFVESSPIEMTSVDFDGLTARLDEELPSENYPDKLLDYLEYLEAYLKSGFSNSQDADWTSAFNRFIEFRFREQISDPTRGLDGLRKGGAK